MSDTSNTPKSQFLIMKIAAITLIAFILAILSFHSYRHNFKIAQHAKNKIPALGPVSARPDGPDLSQLGLRAQHVKGQVLHINFWASWCGPCITELEDFEVLSKELGENYHVLFVNADNNSASILEAKIILQRWAPSAPSLFENSARDLVQKMNVEALPYHILLDRHGRIAAAFFAPINIYKTEFKKLFTNLLEEPL